jgi:hypothetical protein
MANENSPKRTAVRRILWISLAVLAFLSGCATTPYRAHPQFEERLRAGLRVAVMPPDVKVFQITAGEVREQMDEWSEAARKNVLAAIGRQVRSGRSLTFHEFDPAKSQAAREELEDATPLFQAVSLSAILHTYHPETQFQTKVERFDYSLGPLPALAEASESDALLFVIARDHISTGGRVARNIALVLIGAAAGVVIIPEAGISSMAAALVDAHTGDVLWFNTHATGGANDLRDPASAESFVTQAFEAFAKTFPTEKPAMERRP